MSWRNWIAVASAEHVALGRKQGFMQVCHGKAQPLRRLRPGDRVIYYSPERLFRSKDRLQAFTACGQVQDSEPYQVTMSEDFQPWRRNVVYEEDVKETAIRPLLDRLSFTRCNRNWGYQFRFGLFEIDCKDAEIILGAMMRSNNAR